MDLLGSILGTMEKPPSISDAEKKKIKGECNLCHLFSMPFVLTSFRTKLKIVIS